MDKELIKAKIKETIKKENANALVILYGSHARGTATEESDWDILVLLDKPKVSFRDEQQIRHKLFDVELEIEAPISTFVYSLNDWNTRLSATPLFKNVQKDGVYL